MRRVAFCALTCAAITALVGFYSWNPDDTVRISRLGITLASIIPGLVIGTIIGVATWLAKR